MSPWWYREALVGAERGAVKTEFFAALALLEMAGPEAFRRLTPIIHVAAGSYKQAGELFGQVQIMAGGTAAAPVHKAPLHGLFDVFEQEVLYRDGRPGRIERLAAEAGTNEGGKTTTFLADELHEWTGRRERLYTVLSAALTKRTPPGRVCGMSTAGRGRGSIPAKDTDPLLWRLYARGKLHRSDPASRYLFDWREASDHWNLDDLEQVKAALAEAGRAANITWQVDHRAEEILSRKIPRHEAWRYYLNRFVAVAADSWLNELPGAWADCADEFATPADGSDVVVGVDMALHQDSVGVVVAGQLGDGRVGWWPRVWVPTNGAIDHLDVFGTIAGTIATRWRIRSVVYDPRFFQVPANLLEEQGFRVIEFPQSPERLIPADGLLYELLRTRKLGHPGDPVLDEHAANAAWRESERGRYLSKGRAGGHMDLIRAGSMATAELLMPSVAASPPPATARAVEMPSGADFFRPAGRLTL